MYINRKDEYLTARHLSIVSSSGSLEGVPVLCRLTAFDARRRLNCDEPNRDINGTQRRTLVLYFQQPLKQGGFSRSKDRVNINNQLTDWIFDECKHERGCKKNMKKVKYEISSSQSKKRPKT